MASSKGQRKLAAILAADVAGYSRLMADDERATVEALKEARRNFKERIAAHAGRTIDTAGDSVLATFPSVVEAVQCAVEVQQDLKDRNEALNEERRMRFRIGVNLGDVIEESDGTIYGDGVNVAARLEALAEPGGAMISESAHMQVRNRLNLGFGDAGAHTVKNIAEPVWAYRVVEGGTPEPRQSSRKRNIIAAAVPIFAVLCLAVWAYLSHDDTEVADSIDAAFGESALPPIPTGPAIAVLPFDNLGGDPEQAYFADGLAEDILTRLAAFRDLKVISRNSSFQYKGDAIDIRKVGRELSATYVLEGSVRRDTTSIRVTAQLLDTRDATNVWSNTYDRDLSVESIFAIQDEITEQVVATLAGPSGAIAASRIRELQTTAAEDLKSYECVLLAQLWASQITEETHLNARNCLVEVVKHEPNYVEALAWLGQVYVEEIWSGFNPREDGPSSLEAAFEMLNRAVKLDPNHQLTRKVLAVSHYFAGDVEMFRDEARKAVALNPNDTNTLGEMAMWIGFSGDWGESKKLTARLRRLIEEVPSWQHYTEFNYHYRDQNYVAAAASARASLENEHWGGHWYLALAYAGMRLDEKALEALRDARALEPNLTIDTVRGLVDSLFLDQEHKALLMDGHTELMALEESRRVSRPVIAVLPFDNMSGDPDQEYFVDGMTEEIITALSRFQDIAVIGRNSTFHYKNSVSDIRAIAKELGAEFVIEGSVRRSANTVRVTAQLVAAGDGAHLWADTFDRPLTAENIFDTQDQIARGVAVRVADIYGAINLSRIAAASARPSTNLDGYDCVLIWDAYNRTLTDPAYSDSLSCLESAAARYPNDAAILTALSEAYSDDFVFGRGHFDDARQRGLDAARRAIAADPRNQRAYFALAFNYFVWNDKEQFLREAETAIALNPNNGTVFGQLGAWMIYFGAWQRGGELLLESMALNPHYIPWLDWALSDYCIRKGDFDCAIKAALKSDNAMPDLWYGVFYLAVAYAHAGRSAEAQDAIKRLLKFYPDFAQNAWTEVRKWEHDDIFVGQMFESLRGVGLEIPDSEAATQ